MKYGLVKTNQNEFLDRIAFPAQSSVLDEEALFHRVVNQYELDGAKKCQFLDRGDSDIYRIWAKGGVYYLKVYRPPQSLEQTEAEASYVMALSASGVPVVKPVPLLDGRFASEVSALEGKRPMLLFEEAPPPLPSQLDETLLTQIGEKVAMVHVASDEFDTDFGIPVMQSDAFLKERVYYTSQFLSEENSAYLGEVSKSLGHILRELPRKTPDFGLCHADLVMSNIRLTTEGTINLFDFGNTLKTCCQSQIR